MAESDPVRQRLLAAVNPPGKTSPSELLKKVKSLSVRMGDVSVHVEKLSEAYAVQEGKEQHTIEDLKKHLQTMFTKLNSFFLAAATLRAMNEFLVEKQNDKTISPAVMMAFRQQFEKKVQGIVGDYDVFMQNIYSELADLNAILKTKFQLSAEFNQDLDVLIADINALIAEVHAVWP